MNRRRLLARAPALAWALPAVAVSLASLPGAARAQTVDVAGTKFPTTASLGGSTLQLNGAGLRSRLMVRVYTAGLYLPSKTGNPEQAITMPGPKRVAVTMLREIDANELGRLFTRGMQDNAPKDEFSKSIPGTLKLAEVFAARKRLLVGDTFFLDYVPGTGTTVVVNGRPQNEPIKEPEFFQSLLRIWLGNNPADATLKELLLGRTPTTVGGSPGQQ